MKAKLCNSISLFLTLLFLLFSVLCKAQFGFDLNKIKQEANDKLKKATADNVQEKIRSKFNKMRGDFDESNFNYAIIFSDNSGLFETKEKFERNKVLFLEAADNLYQHDKATDEERAKNFNMLGENMFASNRFLAAEQAFKRSIDLYKKSNAAGAETANAISNLGLLYQTIGRFSMAEQYTDNALGIRTSIDQNSTATATSLNNKAVLYKELGRYNEAEVLINKALQVNETTAGKTSLPYAITLNNKAMLLQTIGRIEDAEQLMKEVITIAKEKLKEKSGNYVKLTINLALLYRESNRYSESEQLYLNALSIYERRLGKNHPDYAHLKQGLASLYLFMGKNKEVEQLLNEAADIYKKRFGEKHPAYAATLCELGSFYRRENRLTEAEQLIQKGNSIQKEILGESHPDYVSSTENLAITYWLEGKITEAITPYITAVNSTIDYINRYFAPMSENEKLKFWDKNRSRFERFNSFAVAAPGQTALTEAMYNNQLRTKAILLNATSKVRSNILNSGDSTLRNKYIQWLDYKENLAQLYNMSKAELSEQKINVDSIENISNTLEKELSTASASFKDGYAEKQVTWNTLAKELSSDEALVDIVAFKKFDNHQNDSTYYVALIATGDNKVPGLVILKNGNDLNNIYLKQYRKAIKNNKRDEVSFTNFWKAIDKAIGSKKNIYVSPDGVYNQINLNTLLDPVTGKYLIDFRSITLLTNSKDLDKIKNNPGANNEKTASLFGFPAYGSGDKLPELPGTKVEIESINSILKANGYSTTIYEAENATEENVKNSKASILHFATHGYFLPDAATSSENKVFGIDASKAKINPLLRSGILLTGAEKVLNDSNKVNTSPNNGVLTAYETMNLNLENTDMVVLSACETGLGDVKVGEGIYGLQRAFQIAGARSVIMSLWQVNDEATQELMTGFYKNYCLLHNKQAAFTKAQLQLKTKYSTPFYWGAFVLTGN